MPTDANSDAMDGSDSSDRQGESSDSSNHPHYNYEYANECSHINTERVQQIGNAMSNVWQVINKYGNAPLPSLDPKDANKEGWKIDKDSPWYDVPAAMKEIASAREAMHKALRKNTDEDAADDGDKSGEWWEPCLSNDTKISTGIHQGKQQRQKNGLSPEEQTQFEQVHMEWATNAFAEELEALRNGTLVEKFGTKKKKVDALDLDQNELSFVVAKQESNNNSNTILKEDIDVQVLADIIRSGGNMFSDVEKKMLLRARQRGMQGSDGKSSLSIHELRRRQLN